MDELEVALSRIKTARYVPRIEDNPYEEVVQRIELAVRKVQTIAGEKFFGKPIGSIITTDGITEARDKAPDGHKRAAELAKHEKSPAADNGTTTIAVGEKSYTIPKASETFEFTSSAAGDVVIAKTPDGVYHIYTNEKEYEATNITDVMIKHELAQKSIVKTNLKKHEAYDDKLDAALEKKYDVGGKKVTEHDIKAAIQSLESSKGTSVTGPLSKIDSPLLKVDFRTLLTEHRSSLSGTSNSTKAALIAYLKDQLKPATRTKA